MSETPDAGSLQDAPDTTTGPSVDAVRLVTDVLRRHAPLRLLSGAYRCTAPGCDAVWSQGHQAAAVVAALDGPDNKA